MKKMFFAALAATMMFASCSKDNNEAIAPQGEGAKVIVNINTPESKAAGTAATGDNTITSYSIFIFDATGALVGSANGSASSQEVTTTTKAKDVYVLANAPVGVLGSISNKAALLAYTTNLDQSLVPANSQYSARWATGSAAIASFTQNGSGAFEAAVSVAMKFIAARITVTIDNAMTNYNATATDGSYVMKGVSVLNATSASLLYGSSLIPGTSGYYSGILMTGFAYAPTTVVKTFLRDVIPAGVPNTSGYHFYVFENAATAVGQFPTIVTIEGEYDGQPVYHAIHLAAYEQFATGSMTASVLRGNSYNLTFKLTGNAKKDDGGSYPGDTGGSDDPTEPLVSAKCTVSLSINDWTPVNLVKNF